MTEPGGGGFLKCFPVFSNNPLPFFILCIPLHFSFFLFFFFCLSISSLYLLSFILLFSVYLSSPISFFSSSVFLSILFLFSFFYPISLFFFSLLFFFFFCLSIFLFSLFFFYFFTFPIGEPLLFSSSLFRDRYSIFFRLMSLKALGLRTSKNSVEWQ